MKNITTIAVILVISLLSSCAPSQTGQPLGDINSSCRASSLNPLFAGLNFGCKAEEAKNVLKSGEFRLTSSRTYTNKYQTDIYTGNLNSEPVIVIVNFSPTGGLENILVGKDYTPLPDSQVTPKFRELSAELDRKYGQSKSFLEGTNIFSNQPDPFFRENAEALSGRRWLIPGGEINLIFAVSPSRIKVPSQHNFGWMITYTTPTYKEENYRDSRL